MKKLVSLFVLAVSITACVTDDDLSSSNDYGETTQASTPVAHEFIYLERKPLLASWKDTCEALEGTFRVTMFGCTVETTRSNCQRGAQNGTCTCDVSVREEGDCN